MMDDHGILSAARVELADALKVLLNPNIMDAGDFRKSRKHAAAAMARLDELLGVEPCALPNDWGTRVLGPILRAYFWFADTRWLWCRHDFENRHCRKCGLPSAMR